ncbi:sulfurtransferase [Piscinibacter sakaiensis]|uniref:Thiosulfate sulfurtransferase n=1 Tax=Piscinibacter sakaiensis TaxID=1547922 RepID=A0A0K8P0E0_PISS1|nr:sulfurtransferase [Piscinibacter sakaiensis]GAP36098.1 thiosulfate sulfurtransferase [Piscinibacter sakaiensis]
MTDASPSTAAAPWPAGTLIDAATLADRLRASPPPVVLDASFDLADPGAGARQHAGGHVPGALHAHLEQDLSGPKHGPDGRFRGRHPLPARAEWAATVGRWGIGPGRAVVVLDRQGGMMAARAWWLLRWLGHTEVQVLDGGMAAWEAAGGALETGSVAAPAAAAPYPALDAEAANRLAPTIDAAGVLAELGRVPLFDARAPERYRGEVEPLDACAGHIPGARNRPFKDNLQADGRFKPPSQLRAEFDALVGTHDPATVIQQCGSGVTACHNLLAMAAAGLAGGRLYPGSWSEWSADPARPVARG